MNPPPVREPLGYAPPPDRAERRAAYVEIAITLAVFTAIAVLVPAFLEAFGLLH